MIGYSIIPRAGGRRQDKVVKIVRKDKDINIGADIDTRQTVHKTKQTTTTKTQSVETKVKTTFHIPELCKTTTLNTTFYLFYFKVL